MKDLKDRIDKRLENIATERMVPLHDARAIVASEMQDYEVRGPDRAFGVRDGELAIRESEVLQMMTALMSLMTGGQSPGTTYYTQAGVGFQALRHSDWFIVRRITGCGEESDGS